MCLYSHIHAYVCMSGQMHTPAHTYIYTCTDTNMLSQILWPFKKEAGGWGYSSAVENSLCSMQKALGLMPQFYLIMLSPKKSQKVQACGVKVT